MWRFLRRTTIEIFRYSAFFSVFPIPGDSYAPTSLLTTFGADVKDERMAGGDLHQNPISPSTRPAGFPSRDGPRPLGCRRMMHYLAGRARRGRSSMSIVIRPITAS